MLWLLQTRRWVVCAQTWLGSDEWFDRPDVVSLPHANPMEQSPNQLPQKLPILKYTRQREIETLSGVIYTHRYMLPARCSGGSWGLGALGPAILWGPLLWWYPTFASSWGRWKPPVGSEAEPRRQTHFGNNIGPIENWLKIRYLGRCLHQ